MIYDYEPTSDSVEHLNPDWYDKNKEVITESSIIEVKDKTDDFYFTSTQFYTQHDNGIITDYFGNEVNHKTFFMF